MTTALTNCLIIGAAGLSTAEQYCIVGLAVAGGAMGLVLCIMAARGRGP